MMTEEEAKTKWCPFMRASDGNGGAVNIYDHDIDPDCMCIASKCMAWRWGPEPRHLLSSYAREGWDHIPAEDTEDGVEHWMEPDAEYLARRDGHCGLVGKP